MVRRLRILALCLAVLGLVGVNTPYSQPQSKSKGHSEQKEKKPHQHLSGKNLVGDKIKQNGTHKIHDHGKFSAFANVKDGKIAGINVKHSEKGDVPVTKYKTNKKMAKGPAQGGVRFASVAYAQDTYLDTIWIGYAYIDDFGEEIIYWFPVDMILDGVTGAIEYIPADEPY